MPARVLPKDARECKSRLEAAAFILDEATAAGYEFAIEGGGLLVKKPRELPAESVASFDKAFADYQPEVVQLLLEVAYEQWSDAP